MADISFTGRPTTGPLTAIYHGTIAECPKHGEVGGDFRVYVTGDREYSSPYICPKCFVDWVAASVTQVAPRPANGEGSRV